MSEISNSKEQIANFIISNLTKGKHRPEMKRGDKSFRFPGTRVSDINRQKLQMVIILT